MNDTVSLSPDAALTHCAAIFLGARKSKTCLDSLPDTIKIHDAKKAYSVQDQVAQALTASLGPIKGWKVGASTPESEPFCAPLHQATLFSGDTKLPEGLCRLYGVEAEIVYIFRKDLPLRETPWTQAEVCDAIGSAHAAIEIFDTRFCKAGSQDGLVHLADQGNHGTLIYGPGISTWQQLTPVTEQVKLVLDDQIAIEHAGGNSAGDPIRLLVWLANHAAKRGFPLEAGTVVTTGSMTGTKFVPAGTTAKVEIGSLAPVSIVLP